MGEHFWGLLVDFTSCGGALLGAFGRILRRVGEHFPGLFEDFTSCGEHFLELLEDFTSCVGEHLFELLEEIRKPPDGHPQFSTQSGTKGLPPPALHSRSLNRIVVSAKKRRF